MGEGKLAEKLPRSPPVVSFPGVDTEDEADMMRSFAALAYLLWVDRLAGRYFDDI